MTLEKEEQGKLYAQRNHCKGNYLPWWGSEAGRENGFYSTTGTEGREFITKEWSRCPW